jgi:eukaryotic-like serine/threonine-protein kinase
VGYIEHGQSEDGDMFLVMEWLEGESLAERLSQRGLTLVETVTLGRRVAAALGFAHASGVVHRDVKPSNVFLPQGRIERAMIVDFGIAQLAAQSSELTKTGMMVGTPAYISPEQARGERAIDARADVFSLGAVLYTLLAGYEWARVGHVGRCIEADREIAPRLKEALLAAVAPDPAGRFQSTGDFGAALSGCLDCA